MAHFYDQLPEGIAALTDREAVERYALGADVPAQAIAGLSPAQLNSFPIPGTWSIQQIVCHLMDTDLIASYRMKRIIAEEQPRFDLYDENAFAAQLHYDKLSAERVCEVFRANRHVTADLLRNCPDDAFARTGQHPEVGPMTLGRLVRLYIHHLGHHLEFIKRKVDLLASA